MTSLPPSGTLPPAGAGVQGLLLESHLRDQGMAFPQLIIGNGSRSWSGNVCAMLRLCGALALL